MKKPRVGQFFIDRDRWEADYVKYSLKVNKGNVSATARACGMSRGNFYKLLKKLNLQVEVES